MIDHPQPCYCEHCFMVTQELQRRAQVRGQQQAARQRRYAPGILMGVGGAVAVLSLAGMLLLSQAATVCSSALVSALDSRCAIYATGHDAAIGGLATGVILALIGLLLALTG